MISKKLFLQNIFVMLCVSKEMFFGLKKTLQISECLIHRKRKMVNFEHNKEIETDAFWSCYECGTKKKVQSPHKESNHRPSYFQALILYH